MAKNFVKLLTDNGAGADLVTDMTHADVERTVNEAIDHGQRFVTFKSDESGDECTLTLEAKRITMFVVRDFEAYQKLRAKAFRESQIMGGPLQ